MVSFLLDRNADVNLSVRKHDPYNGGLDYDFMTPLTAAINSKQIEIVRFLLDCHADSNGSVEEYTFGWDNEAYLHRLSPLVVAIRAKDIEIVLLLLKREARVNTNGNVPLIEAVLTDNCDIVRLLLHQRGINIWAQQAVRMLWEEYEAALDTGEAYQHEVWKTALNLATGDELCAMMRYAMTFTHQIPGETSALLATSTSSIPPK